MSHHGSPWSFPFSFHPLRATQVYLSVTTAEIFLINEHGFKCLLAICELPIPDFDSFLLGFFYYWLVQIICRLSLCFFCSYVTMCLDGCFVLFILFEIPLRICGLSSFWKNFRRHFFKYYLSSCFLSSPSGTPTGHGSWTWSDFIFHAS